MEKLFDKKSVINSEDKDDKDSVIKLAAKYNQLKSQFEEFKNNNKLCNKCGNDNEVISEKEIKIERVSVRDSLRDDT